MKREQGGREGRENFKKYFLGRRPSKGEKKEPDRVRMGAPHTHTKRVESAVSEPRGNQKKETMMPRRKEKREVVFRIAENC